MRIVIDMQGLQGGSRSRGIGRYTGSFIGSFIKQSVGHEIYLLVNMLFPDSSKSIEEEYKAFLPKHHFVPFYALEPADEVHPNNVWNVEASELIREKVLSDLAPDFVIITSLFEGLTDNSIISIGRYDTIPTAVLFYDIIPLIYPEQFLVNPMKKKWYQRRVESLKRADLLLAISKSARNEAIEYLDFDKNRVHTISSASDITTQNLSNECDIHSYGIRKPFLMHISAYEERKNFEGLIKAFALLPKALREEYQLVLVCKLNSKQKAKLNSVISACNLNNNEVVLTGFISDEDLVALYKSCYLFVFPSWHEGFGLPALEAMSYGVATIGSNRSSIPEVIGRNDALFDPYLPQSIADKISQVLQDKEFHKELQSHALVQSQKFSWDNTAQIAIEALEKSYQKKAYSKIDTSSSKLIELLSKVTYTRRPLDGDLLKAATAIEQNERVISAISHYLDPSKKPKWRIEGPFDSSYSLALLNREIALALQELGYDVALHSTEGLGDFEPNTEFLEQNPKIKELYTNSLVSSKEYITSRNLYPPRVNDMDSPINMLHHYAWEESGFPREWVDNFNDSLSAMTTLSTHVQKVMIDNGVRVPMLTSGCGVDHWERITPDTSYKVGGKAFKFLHVSSCFPRKGADILLKAYAEAFDSSDNVSLIIKTFANPHNEIHKWLEEEKKKKPNFPSVFIIEDDLTNEALKALYLQCDTLVGPSRAEGFGLPFAEAMLSALPVITTGWGGQLDFCDESTAWLIDYKFTLAKTHFELFDSVWAEPSATHLATLMKEVYSLPEEKRVQKSQLAKERLLKEFTWNKVAQRLVDASKSLPFLASSTIPKIGWISSWNSKCGIASYSEHLINAMSPPITILAPKVDTTITPDTPLVHRCWEMGDGNSLGGLEEKIHQENIETLIIQFNYSFFDFNHFNDFLLQQIAQKRDVIIMMHATTDAELTPHKKLQQLIPAMSQVSRVLVHSVNDLNRLKEYGLVDNVALFPHGILDYTHPPSPLKNESFLLATYGFFLPHKGLLEIIDSFDILHKRGLDIKLKMVNSAYPVPISTQLIQEAKEKIEQLNLQDKIELLTDFLPDNESLDALNSSDLIVFPYQETGESSSASVRYGLASHRPVAVTPLAIFDDVQSASHKLRGTTAMEMADSIEKLIENITQNSSEIQKQEALSIKWCNEHKYSTLGKRLFNMLIAINIE